MFALGFRFLVVLGVLHISNYMFNFAVSFGGAYDIEDLTSSPVRRLPSTTFRSQWPGIIVFIMNNRFILGCCASSVILATLSIAFAIIKTEPCSASVLVEILCVLSTVLIGWQIFMVIDFRNYERKVSELQKEINKKAKELDIIRNGYNGVSFHAFSELYSFLMLAMDGPKDACIARQIFWTLAEIESLVLTGNLFRLRREYQQLRDISEQGIRLLKSDKESLQQYWDSRMNNIVCTSYYSNADFRGIVDDVSNLIKTLPSTQP